MMRSIIWFHHDKPLPCELGEYRLYLYPLLYSGEPRTRQVGVIKTRTAEPAPPIVTSPFVLDASGNIYLYACFDDYHRHSASIVVYRSACNAAHTHVHTYTADIFLLARNLEKLEAPHHSSRGATTVCCSLPVATAVVEA